MSNHYGPKIVTDSILMLVDPVNAKSAPIGTSSVYDLSSNMYDMTGSPGLTWSSDRSNPAVFGFDFGTASPNLVTNQTVDLPSIFTINTWINFPSSQKFQSIFSDAGQSNTLGHIWIYRGSSEDGLRMSYSNGTVFSAISAPGYFTGLNSQWINLCMTLNFSTGAVTFYRDGIFFSTATMTSPVLPRTGLRKVLGNYWTTPEIGNDSTVGRIGYFSIYSRTLSAGEVLRNYEALQDRFEELMVYKDIFYSIDAGNPRSFQSISDGWADLTRTRNRMIFTGASYGPANGGFVTFQGNDNYGSSASIPGVVASDISGAERTYDIWFRRTASTNTFNMVWQAYLPYFAFRSDGQFLLSYVTGTSSNSVDWTQRYIYSGATYSDNVWYNAACTLKHDISATRATAMIYVNGQLVSSQQTAAGTALAIPAYAGIAFRLATWLPQGPQYAFKGDIASMKIYSRILTDEEIKRNFEALRNRFGI